jgi:phosphoribosylformylglycinamidine synthase
MCFAGGFGADANLDPVATAERDLSTAALLFSESNTRFLCEVAPEHAAAFESKLAGIPTAQLGVIRNDAQLTISSHKAPIITAEVNELKHSWQQPLRF